MGDTMTGPMEARSYETLERDCLSGPVLEAAAGEVGLAVAYKNTAFRFAARIVGVQCRSDVDLVNADVLTLDGERFQEMTFEAGRDSGVILARSLNLSPITQAGSKPQRACFYDAELSEIPREDDMLTQVDMDRFVGLADAKRRSAPRTVLVPGTDGTIGREAAHYRVGSGEGVSPQGARWALFAGIIPVRFPKQ